MKSILLSLLGLGLVTAVQAQSVAAPKITAGDRWTYKDTAENQKGFRQNLFDSTVDRVNGLGIALNNKIVDAHLPPTEVLVGSDWSVSRSVNGKRTLVNRPFTFPLDTNKSWTVEFSEDRPNAQYLSIHYKDEYTVVGWEDVTVAAGTFRALKVEASGTWEGTLAGGSMSGDADTGDQRGTTISLHVAVARPATPVSGVSYKAYWYVPGVKRAVKWVEETYDANGKRTLFVSSELQAYKVAGGPVDGAGSASKAPAAAVLDVH